MRFVGWYLFLLIHIEYIDLCQMMAVARGIPEFDLPRFGGKSLEFQRGTYRYCGFDMLRTGHWILGGAPWTKPNGLRLIRTKRKVSRETRDDTATPRNNSQKWWPFDG